MRIDAAEHCEHCGDGFSGGFPCEPRGERDPRLTLMQDEHRPCAFADDEVALPMAGLAAAFNGLRTIMDRRSILDGVARGSDSSPWRPCRTAITSLAARRQPGLMIPPHFRQSNLAQQAMEFEWRCLQMPLRQPVRPLPRTKTLTYRRRRYRPRRRRPMIPLPFRQSNSAQQAMEIKRPCLLMPPRRPLRVLRRIKTLT